MVQWAWKEEVFPVLDQFTSLHDRLVARWRDLNPHLHGFLHFAHVADAAGEDTITTSYLRDTAAAAGLTTLPIVMADIGWHADERQFVDMEERPILAVFKLYPWKWLVDEAFGPQLVQSLDRTLWLEPIWKMIWLNKAILPALWELFPNYPNLLGASRVPPSGADAVAKPLLARDGANVSIRRAGAVIAETGGDYGAAGFVYQELYPLPERRRAASR